MRTALAILLIGATACGTDAPQSRATPTPPRTSPTAPPETPGFDLGSLKIRLRPFASGLSAPLFLTHAGDGSGNVYVVEQGGRIVVIDRDGGRRTFLNLSDRVVAGGEQGLLGLTFHPEDPSRLFVDYTDGNGDTVVAEYRADEATRADRGSERILLRIDQPYANHNGGMVEFGPDGMLYIGTGDGGSGGDPQGNGQRTNTLLGKLLRIDVDGGGRYDVPDDNPYAGGGGRDEIWHTGLRNPWRFSFDRDTGDLWIGDVGQHEREEIDVAPAGRGGLNFGWNLREGRSCYLAEACQTEGLTDPVTDYSTGKGCAVTGGYVYRGTRFTELVGGYLFADYCGGQIWGLDAAAAADGSAKHRLLLRTGLALSSFGEDEAGELYVTDLAGGGVYRVVAA